MPPRLARRACVAALLAMSSLASTVAFAQLPGTPSSTAGKPVKTQLKIDKSHRPIKPGKPAPQSLQYLMSESPS